MRQIRANDLGIAAISFVEGVRDGRPWADYLEVIGPGAVEVILAQLQGWAVSTDVPSDRNWSHVAPAGSGTPTPCTPT